LGMYQIWWQLFVRSQGPYFNSYSVKPIRFESAFKGVEHI
jgi:hypothetical protein